MTPPRRTRPRLLTSLLFAGAALLAIAYGWQWLSRSTTNVPELVILAPAPGDTVRDSLVVRFRTRAPLRLAPHGWAAGALHPHALLDGAEHMAAAGDIRSLGGGIHDWRLPAPAAGSHTLRLGWAGPDHQPRRSRGNTVRFHFE